MPHRPAAPPSSHDPAPITVLLGQVERNQPRQEWGNDQADADEERRAFELLRVGHIVAEPAFRFEEFFGRHLLLDYEYQHHLSFYVLSTMPLYPSQMKIRLNNIVVEKSVPIPMRKTVLLDVVLLIFQSSTPVFES